MKSPIFEIPLIALDVEAIKSFGGFPPDKSQLEHKLSGFDTDRLQNLLNSLKLLPIGTFTSRELRSNLTAHSNEPVLVCNRTLKLMHSLIYGTSRTPAIGFEGLIGILEIALISRSTQNLSAQAIAAE